MQQLGATHIYSLARSFLERDTFGNLLAFFIWSKGKGAFDIKNKQEKGGKTMNERVFADDFKKGFMQEDEFLQFIEQREENSSWQTVKSNELRFFARKEEDSITKKMLTD